MEQLRAIIAANISSLRARAGITQQELALKLNYTDKAVSKWERGESVPDIGVLARVAEIFGVTVDYLITDHRRASASGGELIEVESSLVPEVDPGRTQPAAHDDEQTNMAKLASVFGFRSPGKFTVTLMAAAAVWLVAVIVFAVLTAFVPGYDRAWICFLFAVPATAVVLLIFNLLWGSMRVSFTLMAVCVWTVLGALFIFFIDSTPWTLFLIGVPAQAMILLWQILYNRRNRGK